MPKPQRVTINTTNALIEEIDRVNEEIEASTGLTLLRSDAYRIGILAYVKNVLCAIEGRKVLSIGDIERCLSDPWKDHVSSTAQVKEKDAT